jgi:Big-like domain-containing protein
LTISGGTLSIASAFTTSSTLTISGGTLNDPGAITVGGLLTLSGGTISGLATAGAPSGTGTTTANGGITLNPAGGDFTLDGDTLTNPAGQTATFSGLESGLLEGDGAEFVNDGTFLAQALGNVSETGSTGNPVSFINNGTFTRSVNTSVLDFDGVAFNVNAPGTVDIQTGILNLWGGGTSTGGVFTVESGATLYFGGSAPFTLDSATTLSGTGTVTEDGAGTVTILGNSPSFTGPTDLDAGFMLVDGSQPASTVNLGSGTLGGSGTVGPITSSGTVGDGPGILTAQGNVTLDTRSNFDISINGANPGTGFTQLVVNGTATLTGSQLHVAMNSFTPTPGETFPIITSTAPIVGTFSDLSEGAIFLIRGIPFQISYAGGGGDDVVLTDSAVKTATTTTLSSSAPSGSSFGQAVTFTATVAPSSGTGTPTGTVTFTIDGTAQTPVPLEVLGNVDQASLPPISSLTGGSHTIVASYSGDATFATSSGTTVQAVTRAGSTTTLAASPNTSTAGQTVTLTATVTPDARSTDTPTGTVTFEEGTTVLGTAPLNDGIATFAISTLAVGSPSIAAVYSGDADFATSIGVTTETVNAPTPPPATSTGPRLTGVQRFGFHAMPTTVVLTFDQPLDLGSAEDVRNYVILDPSGHRIRINRAVLEPTGLTVTLHPEQRISIHHPYQLIVNGAGPGAVSNMSGQPLDSVDAGQSGSSDRVVLTWRQLVLGDVSKAFRIRYGLVPKGPRAKFPSGVSSPKAALGNRAGENGDGGGGGENGDGFGIQTRKMVSAHGRRMIGDHPG